MKRILFCILLFSQLGNSNVIKAQTPQKMSYQFVARSPQGILISEGLIALRISLIQGETNGDPVYVETHAVTTNINGAGSLQVGGGIPVEGSFGLINWAQGPYFLKTEIDTEGGGDYVDGGTTEMLSVPYALYAANGFYYKIGDLAQGGIIFSLWKDSNGNEHGLVASLADQAQNESWGAMYESTGSVSAANGLQNSSSGAAAVLCENYTYQDSGGTTYDDYYLPAIWELNELSKNAFIINSVLESDGNFETVGFPSDLGSGYWSSTELSGTFAWFVQFSSGISNTDFKDSNHHVRAIRRF